MCTLAVARADQMLLNGAVDGGEAAQAAVPRRDVFSPFAAANRLIRARETGAVESRVFGAGSPLGWEERSQ